MDTPGVGAYGLRLRGVDGAERLLVDARPEWPELRVVRVRDDAALETEHVSDATAALRLRTGGTLTIDRTAATATYSTPKLLTNDEVVHPYLAPAAGVMAHWHGRWAFHAGAFLHGRSAWAMLGEREAGKSSTLAWLALHGHGVVTDDVLVLDAGRAFAGPRAVDLRQAASEHFEAGTNLGRVGARDRFRVDLGPVPAENAFAGWVFLTWGDAPAVRRLRATELLERLLPQRVLRIPPADPAASLDLAALPAWELARPREWDTLPAAVDLLLDVLGDAG